MTIYRWENGSNPPSNENLLLLVQLFNTSTLYLRGDIDDRDMVLTDSLQSILDEMRPIRYIEHKEYCFNYAITATQRKILKAFDLTPANIRDQAKLLAAELKSIDEGETKKAAAQ